MFMTTQISDLVTIPPDQFSKDSVDVLKDMLHNKYANKVIPHIGLGICVYDIDKTSEGAISQGDGAANVNVVFNLVVFRPFKGEILVGQIGASGEWGMKIKLEFFNDIIIPPTYLFQGSSYDKGEKCWVWKNDGQDFYFDKHEWIRVRVEEEQWHEPAPVAPGSKEDAIDVERKPPYRIVASASQAGMGLINWW